MSRFRSFALTAHVDAGKTTLAERLLYVTGRIHRAGEVRGDRPTQLDHLGVEQRRGITVVAAATTLRWHDAVLQLVDTPGHVDFGVEVERAMSVLDGAVLVVCGVAGAQPQTRTVEAQMARHGVARVAFVNKCDHPSADPDRAVASLRTRLGVHAAAVQWAPALGGDLRELVDLVTLERLAFDDDGRRTARGPLPEGWAAEARSRREQLVDAVSLVDDVLTAEALSGSPSAAALSAALRRATSSRRLVPVLVGSAAKGVGIPPVLDAVVDWLPAPGERPLVGRTPDGAELPIGTDGPVVAFVFKTEDSRHGTWTWLRVFRGALRPGDVVVEAQTGRRHRIGRLGRLHAAQVEPVDGAVAGEVVAAFGLDLPSGTTLCDPSSVCSVGAWRVPEPVVRRSIQLVSGDPDAYASALRRLTRDDPTLKVSRDDESGEQLIAGMGELHLDVVRDLLDERYGLSVSLGLPTVSLRHALRGAASFDHLLKKQNGGPGSYARLIGELRPASSFSLRWEVVGGAVPMGWKAAIEAAFRDEAETGAGTGWPLLGVEVVVTDGAVHSHDSSEHAFAACARAALREVLGRVGVVVLQPMAKVVAESPEVAPGVLASLLTSRGGRLSEAVAGPSGARVEAVMPLSATFGLTTDLRSATRGAGTWALELQGYA